MAKKPNIKFIIEQFWNRGYILYEDTYVNAKTKMKYNCRKHPDKELQITWSDFNSGRGCKYCKNDKLRADRQTNIEDVRKLFDSKGLILVSDTYVNNRTDLEFYCREHDDEIQTATHYCVSKSEVSVCKFCISEYLSDLFKGDKAPNWQGGLRAENLVIRDSLEYRRWRESVFKRDNYTCQKCGNYGRKLQAHHIYPFSDYEDLRFEINNGITLCVSCHDTRYEGSFHNVYGTRNNTKEQLEEYLGRKIDFM